MDVFPCTIRGVSFSGGPCDGWTLLDSVNAAEWINHAPWSDDCKGRARAAANSKKCSIRASFFAWSGDWSGLLFFFADDEGFYSVNPEWRGQARLGPLWRLHNDARLPDECTRLLLPSGALPGCWVPFFWGKRRTTTSSQSIAPLKIQSFNRPRALESMPQRTCGGISCPLTNKG